MAYSDFTLRSVEEAFGVLPNLARLFPGSKPVAEPPRLRECLNRGRGVPLISERARDQLIVMPTLLACRELSRGSITIYSGPQFDVDAGCGLVGACDFLLSRSPPLPEVRAPSFVILQAEKNDVQSGLGPCIAQMIGARVFNERKGLPDLVIHGCVTTGEIWQFLRLEGSNARIDTRRYFLIEVPEILGIFQGLFPPLPAG